MNRPTSLLLDCLVSVLDISGPFVTLHVHITSPRMYTHFKSTTVQRDENIGVSHPSNADGIKAILGENTRTSAIRPMAGRRMDHCIFPEAADTFTSHLLRTLLPRG